MKDLKTLGKILDFHKCKQFKIAPCGNCPNECISITCPIEFIEKIKTLIHSQKSERENKLKSEVGNLIGFIKVNGMGFDEIIKALDKIFTE